MNKNPFSLPQTVVDCPENVAVDVIPGPSRYIVRITDVWGVAWYVCSVYRGQYSWTMTKAFARPYTLDKACEHCTAVMDLCTLCHMAKEEVPQ